MVGDNTLLRGDLPSGGRANESAASSLSSAINRRLIIMWNFFQVGRILISELLRVQTNCPPPVLKNCKEFIQSYYQIFIRSNQLAGAGSVNIP
eukprot:scaffold208318_cov31-Attheya_sp.AAC.1